MPDPTNDIDVLSAFLLGQPVIGPWLHAALTALVAERDALKQRVAELEAQPPTNDLRERLVCAIWPVLIQQWREYKDAIDPRGCARSDALEEADKMIAAMRKGESDGK